MLLVCRQVWLHEQLDTSFEGVQSMQNYSSGAPTHPAYLTSSKMPYECLVALLPQQAQGASTLSE